MTTLAFDGRYLAADSQTTYGNTYQTNAVKIQPLPDGSFYASAGDIEGCELGYHYFQAKLLDPTADIEVPEVDEQFVAIIVQRDGTAMQYYSKLHPIPVPLPWAQGSGVAAALTAMKLGMNARQAVEVVCELDIYTSGPVAYVDLGNL